MTTGTRRRGTTARAATWLTATAMLVASPAATLAQRDGARTNAISASDRAQGAQANPQLLAQFGGAYSGPQADYVRRVGQRIAVESGLSPNGQDFTVTLLNSPVNNAFAIPGGYVYVTRDLLALMNDEAELAFVMGHEVGHVAAGHARKRESRSNLSGLLTGIVGAVVGNSAIGSLATRGVGAAAQLATLGFSRSQENEADALGVEYLARAGYDPVASADMLAQLANQSALDDAAAGRSSRGPSWTSTHPDPASRVQRTLAEARATNFTTGARNRDAFLAAIDGMIYGDDPRQGIVDGQEFSHPLLRIAFTAPQGYQIANGASAVTISGQGGQARFGSRAFDGDLDRYLAGVLTDLGGEHAAAQQAVDHGTFNGMTVARTSVRADTRNGPVDVTVVAYRVDARTAYHFATITAAGTGLGPFAGMTESLRRLSVAEAATIRPRRVRVVTVGAGDTVQSLAARMAYPDRRIERFTVLNGLRSDAPLRAGQKVKLIVMG